MMAPPPMQGGSRVRCPMVDMPAMEEGSGFAMCGWSRKAGRKTLRRYRRHWRRAHLNPFLAEMDALPWPPQAGPRKPDDYYRPAEPGKVGSV
jgi:hypothetical protein